MSTEPLPRRLSVKAFATLPYFLRLKHRVKFIYTLTENGLSMRFEIRVIQSGFPKDVQVPKFLRGYEEEAKDGEWFQWESPDWSVNGAIVTTPIQFYTSLEITIKSKAAYLRMGYLYEETEAGEGTQREDPLLTSMAFSGNLLRMINRFLNVYAYATKNYHIRSLDFRDLLHLKFQGKYGSLRLENVGTRTIVVPTQIPPQEVREGIGHWISHPLFDSREGWMYTDSLRFLKERRFIEALLLSSSAFELFTKELCRKRLQNKHVPENDVAEKLADIKQEQLLEVLLEEAIGKPYSVVNPQRFTEFKKPRGTRWVRNQLTHGNIEHLDNQQLRLASETYLGIINDLIQYYA